MLAAAAQGHRSLPLADTELEAAAKPSRSAPKPKPTMVLEESARNEALMRQLRAKQAEIDTGRPSQS